MTTPIHVDVVSAGITDVFAYPGYPVDDALALIDGSPDLRLVVTVAEPVAVSAAHSYWMMTGRPAAVLLSDRAGVETAAGMLALAVREGAGILVVVPGLLPGSQRSGPLMEAIGATVMDGHDWDAGRAAKIAGRGHVVAVVPGWSTALPPVPPPVHDPQAGHGGIIIGARATRAELDQARTHTCPLVTTPGIRPPEDLQSRWLGSPAVGASPAVFDLIGLGAERAGALLSLGTPTDLEDALRCFGADVRITDAANAGQCRARPDLTGVPDIPDGLPLPETLSAVAAALPDATLIADAGASHKAAAIAASRNRSRLVSTMGPTTMGWGPGAALGAALASGDPVILSIGDGSLAMAGLHLLDWQRNSLRGVVVTPNNATLGSVVARLGNGHPAVTDSPLPIARLLDALEIPWRRIGAGEDPVPASVWASRIVDAGGIAGLIVDTAGHEVADYRLPSGLAWWDEISNADL